MGNLKEIQKRHGWDRWKDVTFISCAVLLTALALGSLSPMGAGNVGKPKKGHVEVVYSGQIEIQR